MLSEGAQLMAFDAATWQPVPLSLPWQGLDPPLCTLSCADGGLVTSEALAVRSRRCLQGTCTVIQVLTSGLHMAYLKARCMFWHSC